MRFGAVARETGEVLFPNVERTETRRERLRGLLGRDSLADDASLWLDRCDSVHTFAMRFPIDLAFLDREGRVRKTVEHVRPFRLSLCFRAAATLEMAAGSLARLSISEGDRVAFVEAFSENASGSLPGDGGAS